MGATRNYQNKSMQQEKEKTNKVWYFNENIQDDVYMKNVATDVFRLLIVLEKHKSLLLD